MFPLRRIKDTYEMKVTSAFGLESSDDYVTRTFQYCIKFNFQGTSGFNWISNFDEAEGATIKEYFLWVSLVIKSKAKIWSSLTFPQSTSKMT